MDVGIRDLKQHLSEYLERVAQGEVIRVTDRGRPKAILGPVPDKQIIERGVADGWLKPGSSSLPLPVSRARARQRVMDVLREDRDGR
jgi:prevent-host-death family protein